MCSIIVADIMAIGGAVSCDYILANPQVPANTATAAPSASHDDSCLGNRSTATLWSFQEQSCLTALGFMALLLLVIHTLSYSASTATPTDRFMSAHRLAHKHLLANTYQQGSRTGKQTNRADSCLHRGKHISSTDTDSDGSKHVIIQCTDYFPLLE